MNKKWKKLFGRSLCDRAIEENWQIEYTYGLFIGLFLMMKRSTTIRCSANIRLDIVEKKYEKSQIAVKLGLREVS